MATVTTLAAAARMGQRAGQDAKVSGVPVACPFTNPELLAAWSAAYVAAAYRHTPATKHRAHRAHRGPAGFPPL